MSHRSTPPTPFAALPALLAAVVLSVGALACSGGDTAELSPLAQEGKDIYQSVCIACHNGNPNLDGAVGPANAGASEELLAAMVVRGEYPEGYTPKRPGSNAMPVFPYLEEKIPALAAYLSEVEESTP